MSVIGYSELLKEIYGITPESLDNEISLLLKSKPTKEKVRLLKLLAASEKATVSQLLRSLKMNNTGGSFKTNRKFFEELVLLKILKKENVGRRTYYSFEDESILKKWLMN
jgi:Fe2+ or Zn2+ uptake regulation protein